jgi:hypothetical protein
MELRAADFVVLNPAAPDCHQSNTGGGANAKEFNTSAISLDRDKNEGGVVKFRHMTVVVFIALATILWTPKAHAQVLGGGGDGGTDNQLSDGFCDASVSGSDCMAGWDTDPIGLGGGGQKDVPCPKATNYDSCIQNCDCEFAKAKKKCNSSPFCINIAISEHDACTGKCITDYT